MIIIHLMLLILLIYFLINSAHPIEAFLYGFFAFVNLLIIISYMKNPRYPKKDLNKKDTTESNQIES